MRNARIRGFSIFSNGVFVQPRQSKTTVAIRNVERFKKKQKKKKKKKRSCVVGSWLGRWKRANTKSCASDTSDK